MTLTRRGFEALRVAAVDRLCADAVAVTFDVPPELAAAYDFAPGQSVTVRREIDGAEHRRSYSVCAPAGAPLRIGVREVPGGLFSRWLGREVRPGDRVEVQSPSGRFVADPSVPGRHLAVAAGSGITPVLSIAASVLRHPASSVTLVVANRGSASVMFLDELADLKDRHGPRLELVHVLSREPRDAELLSGRLDGERLLRVLAAVDPRPGAAARYDHAWLCGPLDLVEQLRVTLVDAGLPPARVHRELFFAGDEPPPRAPLRVEEIPAGGSTAVTVVLDGLRSTVRVPRDRPLLDGLRPTRADLPYACRGGVCGTCRARVTGGRVEMLRNHALEPDEVAAGYTLTCQAVPLDEQVVVDYDA
ncbi:1,2-phenylacetyl-CoA epoxidase subunit PaaE [Nocardioides ferulae]|uniref:1,2-phenylacetyl-CoA epoxidase subunit PaaE n=1 Tax=Nocardioides ferulae TaxID=2340821 RepID=UPI000EAF2BF9|nr:1,2-phenylacetyl-CoA epoxidase subunit PaaE [Nocardioides ferulae]